MDEKLRTTIHQKLADFSDEEARQLLDFMEFLESKYNRSSRPRSAFEKLADNVEGTLRGSSIGGAAIKGTSQVLDAAGELMRGVVSAGRSVLDELQRLEEEAAAAAKEEDSPAGDGPGGEEVADSESQLRDDSADPGANRGGAQPNGGSAHDAAGGNKPA
jgi:hypothetical protein